MTRPSRRRAGRVGALLGALPLALWRAQGGEESFLAGSLKALGDVAAPQLADVLARAERQDAAALEAAIADLGADGTAFQLGLRLADGRTQLDAVGRRVAGTDLVAFLDGSGRVAAAAERAALQHQRDRLRATLDALPLPVWRRDAS